MNNQLKADIMEEIEKKSMMFKKVSNIQYKIRCPLCGDSTKNPNDAHCYIKCDFSNPDEGIKYNCFLCNKGGNSAYKLLKALNADQDILNRTSGDMSNRIGSLRSADISVMTNNPDMSSKQVKFITSRLGEGFTDEDFSKFKIIWDMHEVAKYLTDIRKLNTLPNNETRINFLSDNKSMILSRSMIENEKESQWRKVPLFQSNGKAFYIIQTTINLFTSDKITVNIAEGIFDILSAYKNFNDGENSVYIASLGSDYISALQYMMIKGFVGKNVDVKIYIDHGIDEKSLLYGLKSYRWMYNKISVYKNIKYKDIGVIKERIRLTEVK